MEHSPTHLYIPVLMVRMFLDICFHEFESYNLYLMI